MRDRSSQITIFNAHPDSDLLETFRGWAEAEWGRVDPFFAPREGLHLPSPILAVAGNELVGGLSFTHSTIQGATAVALWINALFVAPVSRGMGIGSKLVMAAEAATSERGISELYVFTSVPALYEKLEWEVVSSDVIGKVLKKELTDSFPITKRRPAR